MAHQHSPRFLKIVEDAQSRVAEITAPELATRLDSSHTQALIDVREASEFAAGHIPTAQHLCKGIIERDIETLVPDPATEIILYCGGGYRSALAADNLQKMGYRRVLSLAGGWRTWTESGLPTEQPKSSQ
ncbi:MAG: sulfurtransferase [Acidobacteria bacterium]|nr:sulfurtransferase [Acidobacteriota bacterium]